MQKLIDIMTRILDTDYVVSATLVASAYVIVVFTVEATLRSIQAGSALPALLWGIPAILAAAFLILVFKGGSD